MGQEMRPPGLLAEGKDHPKGYGDRQEDPSQAGPDVQKQEIERHQREPGRGMRTRETGGARQYVRPVLEQAHVRIDAAEAGDIARAVHVGGELEDADDRRAECDGDHEVSGPPPPWTQPLRLVRADEDEQRSETYRPHQD